MTIVLDATYGVGPELSGVGVYSREILAGVAARAAGQHRRLRAAARPHRLRLLLREPLPEGCGRAVFGESWMLPPRPELFHGLNQRMPLRLRFRRSLCTFHDLFVMTSSEYSGAEFRQRFTAQAQEAARRADLILAVSAFTASQVEALLGVERSRIRVVHHGVRSLPPVAGGQRRPVILTVGAIQRRKNTERLVRAFAAIPAPWRLVLAGSPNGYGAQEAMDAIGASPVRDRIEVTGYVPSERLSALYREASVFAFPSLDEGFGMPVLEAMAHGVPVLASTRSALPEVCGEAAILAEAESVEDIADGLRRLTSNPELRAQYAELGLARSAGFTWDQAAGRTWAAYRELLPTLI